MAIVFRSTGVKARDAASISASHRACPTQSRWLRSSALYEVQFTASLNVTVRGLSCPLAAVVANVSVRAPPGGTVPKQNTTSGSDSCSEPPGAVTTLLKLNEDTADQRAQASAMISGIAAAFRVDPSLKPDWSILYQRSPVVVYLSGCA